MKKKLLLALQALKDLMKAHEKVLCSAAFSSVPADERAKIEQLGKTVSTSLTDADVLLAEFPEDPAKAVEAAGLVLDRVQTLTLQVLAANTELTQRAVELHHDLTTHYVKKTESAELVKTAREEGRKAGLEELQPAVTAMRKQAVVTCGLPEAPEAVLQLPAAEFDARLEQGKATLASLGKRGIDLKGGVAQRLVWQDKEAALCGLKELDELGMKEKDEAELDRQKRLNADPLKGGTKPEDDVDLAGVGI